MFVALLFACTRPPAACENLHALQIAIEEGAPDCDMPLSGLSGLSSGATAPLADVAWQSDCEGLTANACAALHVAEPERTTVAHDGPLALHFLDTVARCADGTRPAFYWGPGSGSGADRWIVYLNGSSGRCATRVDRETGSRSFVGEVCFESLSTPGAGADRGYLHEQNRRRDGILSEASYNPLASWNRVHVVSCSNDQYQGTRVHENAEVGIGDDGEPTVVDHVYTEGFTIVSDVLSTLAQEHGLDQASTVILHGASGGAAGLVMGLDPHAEHTSGLAPEAAVLALIDSRGTEPSLETSEAAFDDDPDCDSVFPATCGAAGFDDPPVGQDVAGFGFDQSAYEPWSEAHPTGGTVWEKLDGWGTVLDADCEAVHGAG